jgi:hypothetical protein
VAERGWHLSGLTNRRPRRSCPTGPTYRRLAGSRDVYCLFSDASMLEYVRRFIKGNPKNALRSPKPRQT